MKHIVSKSTSYHQALTLVENKCLDFGYTFIKFPDGWCGSSSKVEIRCDKHDILWVTSINVYLSHSRGCNKCISELLSKVTRLPDDEQILKFQQLPQFSEGYKFWRNTDINKKGDASYWNYTCDKCSNDVYVKMNLCAGVFKGFSGNLLRGQRCCRCSNRYKWTAKQREYQVSLLKNRDGKNLVFIKWNEPYKNTHSEFTVSCSVHGEWITSSAKSIQIQSSCPSCSTGGYNKDKIGYLYILKIRSNDKVFTGFGISNCVEKRLKTHKLKLDNSNFSVVDKQIFTGFGDLVLDIENKIKYNFNIIPQNVKGFIREATTEENYENIINFAGFYLNKTNII